MEYITDSSGRRVAKKVNGVITKAWLYEGSLRPIAELDSTGNVVSRFVYATNVNVPEYMIRGGATYRIVTDQLGSVRMVVNAATGAVVQEMRYDEFGVVTLDTNPGFTPFGFAGGLYDADTKLLRFGARDYDAETGRWTSKDPIGFNGGDTNLYGYVLADPVNKIDLIGLETLDDYDLAYKAHLDTITKFGPISNITGGPVCFDYADNLRNFFAQRVKPKKCQVLENVEGPTLGWVHANVKVTCVDNSGRKSEKIYDSWWGSYLALVFVIPNDTMVIQ